MSALRDLRRAVGLKQEEFATLLGVPLETLRTWDSGRRPLPPHVLQHAKNVAVERPRQTALVSLDQLADEFGIHQRTLRAAARSGRLTVQFTTRSAFGRPIRHATRAAVAAFKGRYYKRCYSRTAPKPQPPAGMQVPSDWGPRLARLRRRLGLAQGQFATKIGAANKAVVYQWESGKRTPSPVFWQKVEALERGCATPRGRAQKRWESGALEQSQPLELRGRREEPRPTGQV